MRFVIGVGGESASDSSLFLDVLDGRPVIGMRELAPEGVPTISGDASALERADVLTRFQSSSEDVVALLAGHRAVGVVGALADEDGVCSILVSDDPVEYIARRLSAGGDLSTAANDWIKVTTKVLKTVDDGRGRIHLFSAADIANAPQKFSQYCGAEFDIRLEVNARAAPLLERVIASRFASAYDDIRELETELLVRCANFGAPAADVSGMSAFALEKLRSLYSAEDKTEGLQQDNALLREQLRLAQLKAETYFERADGSNWANAGDVARLTAELDYVRHEIAALKNSTSWKVSAPLRAASRAARRVINLKRLVSEQRQVSILRKSDLFDAQWYLENYPDVAETRADPARHYLRFGAQEGRSPSAKFDSSKYLSSHPDVAAAGINPLIHYLQYGRSEARAA